MASIELVLYLSSTLLVVVILLRILCMEKEMESFSLRLRNDAASLLALRQRKEAYRRLQSAQRITESVFNISAVNLRRVHMSFTGIPFGLLESIPRTRNTAKIIRQTHDLIAEFAYGSILGVNQAAGRLTRNAIDQRWGRFDSNRQAH